MKEYEFQGKNVEQAIENGLKELNKKQEDVDIKIVNEGGLFKKAKVILCVEEEVSEKPVKEQKVKEVKEEKLAAVVEETLVEIVAEEKPAKVLEEKTEEPENKPAKKSFEKKRDDRVRTENKFSKQTLLDILEKMNIQGEVTLLETDEYTKISISSDKAGQLIGYRGDSLNALQYLLNVMEQKENPQAKRIILDIQGYRDRREEALKALADRTVEKALKTNRYIKLEPMPANERKVIHTYLQDRDDIETFSQGEEPRRYLTIKPIQK